MLKPLTPLQKEIWRSHLAAYGTTAEAYRTRRDYTQKRLYTGLGLPASEWQEDDCSAYSAKAFYRANALTGIRVRDPLGAGFNRSGNTDTCFNYMKGGGGKNVTAQKVYWPGDVAIFDNPHTGRPTDHMMWCRKKGSRETAVWSSHGHESSVFRHDAPEGVSLDYAASVLRLVAVYRPAELV